MKLDILALLSLTIILTFSSEGQTVSNSFESDSAKIISIAQELLDAAGSGDTAAYYNFLNEDYIIRTEDGSLKNKRELISESGPLPKGYSGNILVTKPVVKRHGNIFILSFIAEEHLTLYGQTLHTFYTETDTYRKKDSGWELLASELFELPSDPVIQNINIEKLKGDTGTYQLSADVQYKVFMEGGKLFGQRTGRDKIQLLPETENVFFIPHQRGRKIFISDENGMVIKMLDRRSGVDLVWTKIL